MALHRVGVTIAGYGGDEDAAERMLEAFVVAHPEVGPVVSQDTVADTLTVVFALDAEDANEAYDEAKGVFLEGARASKLPPKKVVAVNVALVEASDEDPARELELA